MEPYSVSTIGPLGSFSFVSTQNPTPEIGAMVAAVQRKSVDVFLIAGVIQGWTPEEETLP